MVNKTIWIDYRENGALADAYEVVLASENNHFGLKESGSNTVIYPNNTAVSHVSTGRYEKSITVDENVIFTVSWRITPNSGDSPKYVIQEIGPFSSTGKIRAVADKRGSFIQGNRSTLFLRVTNLDGNPIDANPITCTITNDVGDIVATGTPERASTGFYAFDWDIADSLPVGDYGVSWEYTTDYPRIEVQEIVVAPGSTANPPSLYASRILEFRQSLELMITCAQNIPVYSEPAKASADYMNYMFSFKRWNQSPGCRIYVNDLIVTSGVTVNYFTGSITFDEPLTSYDKVKADYNFRWFSDEELDRFLSNAMHLVNLWPPVQRNLSLYNVDDRFIPLILYGAAVDAIRHMMMCLQFQEPQMVFGGAEAASKVYSNLEGLKKNYEETWNAGIEQKKNGPYVGLTRTIVTPEFALPGGRSRWFRYLFSNGAGG
jgi:hypothetical protein